jgi:hypothetical protein
MKRMCLLLVLISILAPMTKAQSAPPQAPPSTTGPSGHDQMRSEQHQKMTETHKKHMESMKADLER